MKLLTAKTRITLGLVCLLVSILCTAMMIGIVPERNSAVLEGRANLCETIAVSGSDYISRAEPRRLEFLLKTVVERNDDVLSAGVRRANGMLVAQVGDHAGHWAPQHSDRSSDTHVHVPICNGDLEWGRVELRFRALSSEGVAGWIEDPWVQLTAFVITTSFFLFLIYLKKMLAHLDPSKTVPKRVRAALDSLAEGLLVIDKDQRIVLANQSFASWIGRSPEKMIGVYAAKLDWVKDGQGAELTEYPWVEAIRLERPQAGVMLGLRDRSESIRVLMANASPVLGHKGKYGGVLVSFDDVTQLEATRKDLKVAKKVAEDANQAKSEFLARMSHEIRTPMNAIMGFTDVLRRGFDESVADRQQYLDTIHGSGEHLLALINDILDLSKIESGQMELDLKRFSPHQLIDQVVTLLRSKAEEKHISLDFECDGRLPETILTDAVRLRQTIMNLAGNAIKFTEQGGVRIVARLVTGQSVTSTDATSPAASRTLFQIDVIDTGIGISAEAQGRIFDPFAQADTSITRRFGGTGLGLAISRQLAEAMGGELAVTSQQGHGSTFTITCDPGPLDDVALIDADTALANVARRAAAPQQIHRLPPARILVADDGPSNRKLVILVLGRAGVEVVAVENGQQAVEQTLRQPFDAILMDMQMPVMDGYTATQTLREVGYERPIIALTADAMQGAEEKCRAAGCSGYLTKPINIDQLLATMAEVLIGDDHCALRDDFANALGSEETADSRSCQSGDLRNADSLTVWTQAGVAGTAGCRQDNETPSDLPQVTLDIAEPRMAVPPEPPSLESTLPLDDPDFLEIAEDFVQRLPVKLVEMREAFASQNCSELATLAHWLRGSGGTAGFEVFGEPTLELEKAAKSGQVERLGPMIDGIVEMADRIKLPAKDPHGPGASMEAGDERTQLATSVTSFEPSILSSQPVDAVTVPIEVVEHAVTRELVKPKRTAPPNGCTDLPSDEAGDAIYSSLPLDDPDFREIVEDFMRRAEEQFAAMDLAWAEQDFDQLARLAHWMIGSGGTAGFDAFTGPAKTMHQLAKQQDAEQIPVVIDDMRNAYGRIVLRDVVST